MPFARCPILFALATILIPGCVGTSPAVAMEDVEAIDIHLDTWGERQKAADTSTQDAGKIEGLLAVLRTAARTTDHKCGDTGTITLRLRGGAKKKIGILAGHDARYYDFRVYRGTGERYDMYRVKRAPFLEAMAGVGANGLDHGSPQ